MKAPATVQGAQQASEMFSKIKWKSLIIQKGHLGCMRTELAGETHDQHSIHTDERRLKAGVTNSGSQPFCVKERIPPKRPNWKNCFQCYSNYFPSEPLRKWSHFFLGSLSGTLFLQKTNRIRVAWQKPRWREIFAIFAEPDGVKKISTLTPKPGS